MTTNTIPGARRGASGHEDFWRIGGEEKPTIVKRLINGSGLVPAIPIVWGISATVERFNAAMADMQGRATLPNVMVDSVKVQASGLLKDTIVLDVPKEAGEYDTVLVRRGTDKLKEIADAWAEYAKQQDETDTVLPLMVLQVPTRLTITISVVHSTRFMSTGQSCQSTQLPMFLASTARRSLAACPFHTSRPSGCRNRLGCGC